MDSQMEGNDELLYLKEKRQQLEERIESRRIAQDDLINSLGKLVPNLVSSLDLSLKVVSAFNGTEQRRRFKPHKRHSLATDLRTPRDSSRAGVLGAGPAEDKTANSNPNPSDIKGFPRSAFAKGSGDGPDARARLLRLEDGERAAGIDGKVSQPRALSIVKIMVAAVLLDRTPFNPIDSAAILRKLENDHPTAAEKNALVELGGEIGGIAAVEAALKTLAEENAGVELEEFLVSGRSRIMILGIDRSRLAKELPETHSQQQNEDTSTGAVPVPGGMDLNGALFGMNPNPNPNPNPNSGPGMPRPDMWPGSGADPTHMHGVPGMAPPPPPPGAGMFPGAAPGQPLGPRGGPRGMGMMGMPGPGGMGIGGFRGVPPMHRPPLGPVGAPPPGSAPPAASSMKARTEEDDLKDLEAMLNKKSFREMQKSKTGEELLDLIHRPTAREAAVAAKFKTKGGPQLKVYCSALTKEDCRRQGASFMACEQVHFRRIIAPHTDINLGDCSFLDTCRHMKTCKYVHYELDSSPDVPGMMMGTPGIPPQKPLKPQRAEYCSEVELGEAQWINCDIRTFRVDILGQFGVIMADPPWDIHMELPYGTMADDEMRNLNVPTLQTDGLIFLWVTGRAMELGRECLELWGYRRVEELIWVKTNQLQRIIRTGRTGHWLNHSKEHCLVGIKGNPEVNRNIDTDVIVAEVRETSRKPDEMYPMLERISPRTRKLELFARMHNTHAGWISLGNQLNGVRLVDEGLRARFKAAYPDTEVQPLSPPRASVVETEATTQARSPFTGIESRVTPEHVTLGGTENFASEDKPMVQDEDLK